MIAVCLSILAIFLVLVLSEYLWNSKKLRGELGRKFVHISVGCFVASWPFYMSFRSIQMISLAFFVVVLLARKLKVFAAIHTVDRKSWGDVLFAVGIGLAAVFTKSDWIFLAAILNLSLADGLAGLIGKRYGKNSNYKVFGYTKSVVGTLTFWLVSLAILLFVKQLGDINIGLMTLVWLPVLTAIAENIGIYGLDNVLVPLLITMALRFV
ncbi:MAG: hypothetical protein ACXWLH_03470 [Candidatus Saccharimonadales bacterium]